MNNSPLVSILIPVYNVEAYLRECLDSVLGQTYRTLQVVLIDDGSKDGSWDVMREYAAKDSRVEIYHQENQGVASTRNHLLEKVKGEYVLFVDSDDWIESDMVEFLLGLAQQYHAGFVMCDRVINDTPVIVTEPKVFGLNQEKAVEDFLYHDYFVGSLCNKLLSSNLLHNERFHCGILYGEDALFCWKVLQKLDKVVVTSKQLYHYRMNDTSISHSVFDKKKFTGHYVWKEITENVEKFWPQYISLAQAHWAASDTVLLRNAVNGGTSNLEYVNILKMTVKKYRRNIVVKDYSSFKARIFAVLMIIYPFQIKRKMVGGQSR